MPPFQPPPALPKPGPMEEPCETRGLSPLIMPGPDRKFPRGFLVFRLQSAWKLLWSMKRTSHGSLTVEVISAGFYPKASIFKEARLANRSQKCHQFGRFPYICQIQVLRKVWLLCRDRNSYYNHSEIVSAGSSKLLQTFIDDSDLYKGVRPYLCSQLDFPCTVEFGKGKWATIEGYICGMQGGCCGTPSFALQLGV